MTLHSTRPSSASLALRGVLLFLGALPVGSARADIACDSFTEADPKFVMNRNAAVVDGRLRVTHFASSQAGEVWYADRQSLVNGFETTFHIHLNKPDEDYYYGTDGVAFVIQNSSAGTAATGQTGANGLASQALNIKFDSWLNAPSDGSASGIQVRSGNTILKTVNLATIPGVTLDGPPAQAPPGGGPPGGFPIPTLTSKSSTAPSLVRIVYTPGTLDIWFQGVKVVDAMALDLNATGALDAQGTALVGFTSSSIANTVPATGEFPLRILGQNNDVTSWHLTAQGPPPVLTSHQFDFTNSTLQLTWTSQPEKTYAVTQASADLSLWTPLTGFTAIPSAGESTSVQVPIDTSAPMNFYRVEEN